MTRCADFWKKWRKEPNFCGLSPQAISEIKGYLELVEKLTRSGIQEETIFEMCPSGACRPLLRLSDDETKTEGINYLIRHLKDGEKVTAKNLKATINAVLKKDATCEVRSTHLRTEKSPITADSPKGTLPIKPDSSTTPAAPEIQNAPTAQDPHALSALIAGTVPPEPAAHNPPPCKGGGGCPHGMFKPRVSKDAIKGNMCDAIGIEIAQLPGNVCPYDVKLARKSESAFVPASGDLSVLAAKPVEIPRPAYKIVHRLSTPAEVSDHTQQFVDDLPDAAQANVHALLKADAGHLFDGDPRELIIALLDEKAETLS